MLECILNPSKILMTENLPKNAEILKLCSNLESLFFFNKKTQLPSAKHMFPFYSKHPGKCCISNQVSKHVKDYNKLNSI